MKFLVKLNELKAAFCCASMDPSRGTLMHVQAECQAGNDPLLVSTDGRRLSVVRGTVQKAEEGGTVLIPRKLMLLADRVSRKNVAIEITTGLHRVGIESSGFNVACSEPEGDYPKWQTVFPKDKTEPTSAITLGTGKLSGLLQAASLLASSRSSRVEGHSIVRLRQHGHNGAVEVRFCNIPNFYGIIMPIRSEAEDKNGVSARFPALDWLPL